MRLITLGGSALAALFLASPVLAQKKALTQADWDRWRSIQAPTLSPDGRWAAYTLSPQVGDGEFVVRSTTSNTEYRVPVGYIGRPNNTPGGARAAGGAAGGGGRAGGVGGGGGGANGPFTADSRYAFVSAQATRAQVDSAAKAAASARGRGRNTGGNAGGAGSTGGNAAGTSPTTRNTIMMISLADGKITPMPEMRSYRLPRDNGKWMVYTTAPDSAATAADSAGRNPAAGTPGAAGATPAPGMPGGARSAGRNGAPASRLTLGTPITLRNMETMQDERIADVVAYMFDDSAKVLAYTIGAKDSTQNGVYIRNMANGVVTPVITGAGNYRNFAFDRTQTKFVFSSDRDEFGKDSAQSVIYVGSIRNGKAEAAINKSMLPPTMRLASNGAASFNRARPRCC